MQMFLNQKFLNDTPCLSWLGNIALKYRAVIHNLFSSGGPRIYL